MANRSGLEDALASGSPTIVLQSAGLEDAATRRSFLKTACVGLAVGLAGGANAQNQSLGAQALVEEAAGILFRAQWGRDPPRYRPASPTSSGSLRRLLNLWKAFDDRWAELNHPKPDAEPHELPLDGIRQLAADHQRLFQELRDALPASHRQGLQTYSRENFDVLMLERLVDYMATQGLVVHLPGYNIQRWTASVTDLSTGRAVSTEQKFVVMYNFPDKLDQVVEVSSQGMVVRPWEGLRRFFGVAEENGAFSEMGYADWGTPFLRQDRMQSQFAQEESFHRALQAKNQAAHYRLIDFWQAASGYVILEWPGRREIVTDQSDLRLIQVHQPPPAGYVRPLPGHYVITSNGDFYIAVPQGSADVGEIVKNAKKIRRFYQPPDEINNMTQAVNYAAMKLMATDHPDFQRRMERFIQEVGDHEKEHVEGARRYPELMRRAGDDEEALIQVEILARLYSFRQDPHRYLQSLLNTGKYLFEDPQGENLAPEARAALQADRRIFQAILALASENPSVYGMETRSDNNNPMPQQRQIAGQMYLLSKLTGDPLNRFVGAVQSRARSGSLSTAHRNSSSSVPSPETIGVGLGGVAAVVAAFLGVAAWRYNRMRSRGGRSSGLEEKEMGQDYPGVGAFQKAVLGRLPAAAAGVPPRKGYDHPDLIPDDYESYRGIDKTTPPSDWVVRLQESLLRTGDPEETDEAIFYRNVVRTVVDRLKEELQAGRTPSPQDRALLSKIVEEANLVLGDSRLRPLEAVLAATLPMGDSLKDALDSASGALENPVVKDGLILVGGAALASPVLEEQGIQTVGIARSPEEARGLMDAGLEETDLIVVNGDTTLYAHVAVHLDQALEMARSFLQGAARIVVITQERFSQKIGELLDRAGWSSQAVDAVLDRSRAAIYA
ncbi:MAG: twin-arginine translocation signal domain-containing protein [Candidatus Omnitrophica bacterium]|nr:twin-arginine translocation signal domain-containing protein [Candidatus Omnitrophota bacterium]